MSKKKKNTDIVAIEFLRLRRTRIFVRTYVNERGKKPEKNVIKTDPEKKKYTTKAIILPTYVNRIPGGKKKYEIQTVQKKKKNE